jgi:hypothetical protein
MTQVQDAQPFLIERLVKFMEDRVEFDLNSKETPIPVRKPSLNKDENCKRENS